MKHFRWIELIDGDRSRGGRHNNGLSHLQVHDRHSLDRHSVTALGNQAHDVFFVDGSIGTCSSGDGQLVTAAGWRLRTGGFPRGIAYGAERILVGISPRASRARRHMQSPVVRVFTRAWQRVTDVVLPGAGMVLAIAPLPERTGSVGLEIWPDAIVCDLRRSGMRDGGPYEVADGDHAHALVVSEWHEPGKAHRWTAARQARMTVVVNPGDTSLAVSATATTRAPTGPRCTSTGGWSARSAGRARQRCTSGSPFPKA